MVKPPLRTKSIGFKVSEEEYAQLETAAQASGQTLGEWCREVVMENASGQETKPTGPGGADAQALMAELVALRSKESPQRTDSAAEELFAKLDAEATEDDEKD
jgi:hypothetical protein